MGGASGGGRLKKGNTGMATRRKGFQACLNPPILDVCSKSEARAAHGAR